MTLTERRIVWPYTPSTAAAVVFTITFLSLTALQCWKIWRSKAKFCIAFAVGGFFEFVGYAARASARNKMDRMMPLVIQNFFILVAPALFAATIYMTLGRVIRLTQAEKHSLVPARWLTKAFVSGDVLSFVVQGAAAPLMIVAEQKYLKIGTGVVVVGLFIQIVMFGLFMVMSFLLERRLSLCPTPLSLANKDWRVTVHVLYGVSTLIMIRSVFRVVEYIMGYNGYLLQHEWPLYVFDAPLMAIMMALYAWKLPKNLTLSIIDRDQGVDEFGCGRRCTDTKL